jgi:hypothetical protein
MGESTVGLFAGFPFSQGRGLIFKIFLYTNLFTKQQSSNDNITIPSFSKLGKYPTIQEKLQRIRPLFLLTG